MESQGVGVVPGPCKEALVWDNAHNLLLESSESAFAFAIQRGHLDVKESEKRVRSVFYSRRHSSRGPREAVGDTELVQWFQAQQGGVINIGDL